MAQPNVAREPSMDEILASIRKIIENNEANPELAPDAESDDGFDISTDGPVNFEDRMPSAERFDIAAARPSLVVPDVEPLPRAPAVGLPAQGVQPAMSLADVAARVRAASERHVAANRDAAERAPAAVEPVQSPVQEQSPLVTARMAATANRPSAPVAEPVPSIASIVDRIEPIASTPEPVAKPVEAARLETRTMEPVRVEPAFAEPKFAEPRMIEPKLVEPKLVEPQIAGAESVSRDLAALISPSVGDRVAESFGALAAAIDAGPRRSFDDIAEEMLRPMLQDWLEDNLPTLVERLVREEIERVARGPRR